MKVRDFCDRGHHENKIFYTGVKRFSQTVSSQNIHIIHQIVKLSTTKFPVLQHVEVTNGIPLSHRPAASCIILNTSGSSSVFTISPATISSSSKMVTAAPSPASNDRLLYSAYQLCMTGNNYENVRRIHA